MDNRRIWHHRLRDFIQLIRWWNLLIAAGGFLISYSVWIAPVAKHHDFSGQLLSIPTLLGIAIVIMYMLAFGYIHNDWRDRLADKINVHDRPLVHHNISRGKIIITLVIIGLLGWLLAIWIGCVLNKMEFAVLFPVIPLTLYFYNRYIKHQPLLGNILVAGLCAIVPWLAWLAIPNPDAKWELAKLPFVSLIGLSTLSLTVFFIMLAHELVKDLQDRAGDLAAGSKTLPIVKGTKFSKQLVTLSLAMIPVLFITAEIIRPESATAHFVRLVVLLVVVAGFILLSFKAYRAKNQSSYEKLNVWIKQGLVLGSVFLIYNFGPWNF